MPRIVSVQFDPPAQLGNNALHYLLARILQAGAPGVVLTGDRPPAWITGESPVAAMPTGAAREVIELYGHVIALEHAIARLRASDDIAIRTRSLALRMEYFGRHLALAREIFPPPPRVTGFADDHIVFQIRTGDVYRGGHPNYTLLPIDFYRRLIAKTGLRPAFVGQIEDNEYCRALRKVFPGAPFCHGTPMEDFHMLRTSRRIVLGVSTFGWLAAWLSEIARQIVYPAIGMLNPLDRPEIDIMPVGDARYQFYAFPGERWTGADAEIAAKISGKSPFRRIAAPRLFRAAAILRARREGRLPDALPLWRALGLRLR